MVAQATAYSAMLALVPALIVAAAVLQWLPETTPLRVQLGIFFDRVLPSNVSPLLGRYFAGAPLGGPGTATAAHGAAHGVELGVRGAGMAAHTARSVAVAAVVSVGGAAGVMTRLMEGFRRAHGLKARRRSYWRRQLRALALVPLSLLPMAAASALVVFGHGMTHWLGAAAGPALRGPMVLAGFALRWGVAIAGSVAVIAMVYHLGTDVEADVRDLSWRANLPGAAVATALWLGTTLGFGVYVTRFANYSRVYGPLGAAIALLVWLYLIALSVLMGAEFNAVRGAVKASGEGDR